MDGRMEVKAVLRIAYSNQKLVKPVFRWYCLQRGLNLIEC
jgi:hypothetical protein